MAAPANSILPVGLRHGRVYAIDANGRIAATSTTVYEGVPVVGVKGLDITIPDVRRIVHTGDDIILAQDFLPRQEVSSATLTGAMNDHDVHALLSSTNAFVIGESPGIGYGTSRQGYEADVGALFYQQAKDYSTKARRYRNHILPLTNIIINPPSMNENAPEFGYQMLPQIATQHIWGVDFAAGTEGFTTAEWLEFITVDIPHIAAWKGDGSTVEFTFHADRQAVSTDKIHVVTNQDTVVTETEAVTGITFAVAPTSGNIIVCYYEYAD